MKKTISAIRSNPKLFWGCFLLLLLVAVAVFGPSLCKNPPDYFYDDMLHAPSAQYPLGTDGVGADVLTLVLAIPIIRGMKKTIAAAQEAWERKQEAMG